MSRGRPIKKSSKKSTRKNTGPRKRKEKSPSPSPPPKPQVNSAGRKDGPPPAKTARNSATTPDDAANNNNNVAIVEEITPTKSLYDPHQYKIIKLSNGLTAVLISRRDPLGSQNDQKGRGNNHLMSHDAPLVPFGRIPCPRGCCDCGEGCGTWKDLGGDGSLAGMLRPGSPPTPSTSICVVINVGSTDDPEECQGLSHFLEHVVHFGSRNHPKESTHSLIHLNFGSLWNASTMPHSTCYYHEIPDSLLNLSMDNFADMIAQPTMLPDLLGREVNSVDNEFYLRQCEHLRHAMLSQQVFIQNQSHPLARFQCGNLNTLGGGGGGGDNNNSGGVQNFMREHHKKNYVASAMTLCINSTKSIPELEHLTLRHFSKLLQDDWKTFQKTDDSGSEKVIFQNQNKLVILQGINNTAQLVYNWHLPGELTTTNEHDVVMPLIASMFSDSSTHGLQHYLKSKNLIWAMFPAYSETKYATIFGVTFLLTKNGQSKIVEIQQATFAFIQTLKDTPEREMNRHFQELRISQQKMFDFGPQHASLHHTLKCATQLQLVAREQDILTADSMNNAQFNYSRTKDALSRLQPKNLLIISIKPKDFDIESLQSLPQYKKTEVKHAQYTNAKYIIAPRDDKLVLLNCKTKFKFQFSPSNPVLSGLTTRPINHGQIKPQSLTWQPTSKKTSPFKIIVGVHYGHQLYSHNSHRGIADIQLVSPSIHASPRSYALYLLWAACIHHNTSIHSSQFAKAGYNVAVDCTNGSILVRVEGFPCHMKPILEAHIDAIFHQSITSDVVEIAKEHLKYAVVDNSFGSNLALMPTVFRSVLFGKKEIILDCASHLEKATLNDLNNAIVRFKRSSYVVIMLQGNVPTQLFHSIAGVLEKEEFRAELGDIMNIVQGLSMPSIKVPGVGERCVRLKSETLNGYCTSVNNVYILGRRDKKEGQLFTSCMALMECQAFLHLRTRCQLGYGVHTSVSDASEHGIPLMMFAIDVTSTARKFSPCEINAKIDEFLNIYGNYLGELTEQSFEIEILRKLERIPADMTPQRMAAWYKTKFGPNTCSETEEERSLELAMRGIRKLSLQIVGGNEKPCSCRDCQTIKGWKLWGAEHEEKKEGNRFLFAVGNGHTKDYFVSVE